MGISIRDKLTAQFYEWEQRGRGWQLYDYPVDLEPPFVPFFFHHLPRQEIIDDGIRHTWLSSIADFVRGRFTKAPVPYEEHPYAPAFPFKDESPLCGTRISFPRGRKIRPEEWEQLLVMLSDISSPISFEIIGKTDTIIIQLVYREHVKRFVEGQLRAYFPDLILFNTTDTVLEILTDENQICALELGLRDEFMRPLMVSGGSDPDILTSLFGILEHLDGVEEGIVQILFNGSCNPWGQSIVRAVSDDKGGSFFIDAPEMVQLAKEKVSRPLFGVAIRVIGQADSSDRASAIAEYLSNAFGRIFTNSSNSLIPLIRSEEEVEEFVADILFRQSHRLGMLLNSKELATLVHYPSSVMSLKMYKDIRKTKLAPDITEGHTFVLGINEHNGIAKKVTLASAQRLKHTHVIGATGTGKSTFLLNCIVQDIQNGEGIAVLDPHGDLIENIIPWIPEERLQDVIIFDPSDAEFPVGFNILTAHSEIEKDILSSDLVAVFRRLSTSWGDQMNSVFANAILAFLESSIGGTLIDLRRFLIEKSFRDTFLKTVTDPNVIYYWQKEFPMLKGNSIASILTRLDTFLRPKLIRNMVAQKQGLNFADILDTKKILLIKLSQGLIGAENSYLLGSFIVSKIQQVAMARQAQAKESRSDFYLYIDEFQYFICPSMSAILSGARKYHLGLILAHQDMQQLVKQDSELASSVLSNAGTRICFRIGDTDAKKLEDGFSFFDAKDLQNLGTGEAIARVDRPEYDFSMRIDQLPACDSEIAAQVSDLIVSISRKNHGTPRLDVEKLLEVFHKDMTLSDEMPLKSKIFEQAKNEVPKSDPAPLQNVAYDPVNTEKKEQNQHRYLQTLVKKMAESRGFKSTLEVPTPDGKGRIDVVIERNGKKIAVETCVTTDASWEAHNITKCLDAGYDLVIECSSNKKTLHNIGKKIKKLTKGYQSKLLLYEPEELFAFLDAEIAKEGYTEIRQNGYIVKVEYEPTSPDQMNKKRESIAKAIVNSIKTPKI